MPGIRRLDFRELGNLVSEIYDVPKGRIWDAIGRDKTIRRSRESAHKWDSGKLKIPEGINVESLCGCMFAPAQDEWIEDKNQFELIKKYIERMKLADIGKGASEVLSKPYDPESNNTWMLCYELTKQTVDNSNAKTDETPMEDGAEFANQFDQELAKYRNSISSKLQSVLSKFETSTIIDVSHWPDKPYGIKQTIRQTRTGAHPALLHETPQFQDMIKAASFKYTSVSIFDEQGNLIVSIDNLPHYRDFTSSETPSYPKPKKWRTQCRLTEEMLDDFEESVIPVLWYTAVSNSDGITISLRSWKPHDSHYLWSTPWLPKPLEKRDKHDIYYTTSLEIDAPANRELSVEVSCEYEAMSISENKYFRDLVFEPSIKAEIIHSEANEDYEFVLHQYSSQSPFWRRDDGKHYIEQLAVKPFSPHLLWWKYDNQWLMLGEGYAIVVDAQRKTRGD